MKNGIAAATIAGLVLCSVTEKAEAFQYVFHGTVTDTSNDQNVDADYLKGKPITITFEGNSALATQPNNQTTDLTVALRGALAKVGSDIGYFSNDYLAPSSVTNDGSTSSLSFDSETSSSTFGPFQGFDGGLLLSAASTSAGMPLDPEQSFGLLGVTGSGRFYAPNSLDPVSGTTTGGGYLVAFSLNSMQGFGAVSAVPLPGAAPLFGAALLAFAVLGHHVRRRATASMT